MLDDAIGPAERGDRVARMLHSIGKFQNRIDQTADVESAGQQHRPTGGSAPDQPQGFGRLGDRDAGLLKWLF